MNKTLKEQRRFMDLSTEEVEALAQKGVQKAIDKMHSKGVATVTVIDGMMYREFPDGTLEPIAPVKSVW